VEDEDNADYILQFVANFGDQMPNQAELKDCPWGVDVFF
jgi:hypothetical protein